MTDLQFRHKYRHSGRAQGVRARRTQAHIEDFGRICERANNPKLLASCQREIET